MLKLKKGPDNLNGIEDQHLRSTGGPCPAIHQISWTAICTVGSKNGLPIPRPRPLPPPPPRLCVRCAPGGGEVPARGPSRARCPTGPCNRCRRPVWSFLGPHTPKMPFRKRASIHIYIYYSQYVHMIKKRDSACQNCQCTKT